jgi:PadR family transcriptional regulator
MLLLAVIHLGEEAYAYRSPMNSSSIVVALCPSEVYAALGRLEAKGLIISSLGDFTPERCGKAKRYFRITNEGLRQVYETCRVLTRLWQTIPVLKLEFHLEER